MPQRTKETAVLIAGLTILAFSLVVWLVCAHLYSRNGIDKSAEFRIYALSFAIVPILSAAAFQILFVPSNSEDAAGAVFRGDLFLCLNATFVFYLIGSLISGSFSRPLLLCWVVAQIAANAAVACALPKLARFQTILGPGFAILVRIVFVLAPPSFLMLVLFGSTRDIAAQFADKTTGYFGLSYSGYFELGAAVFLFVVLSSMFLYGPDRRKPAHRALRAILEMIGVFVAGWLICAIALSPNPDVQTLNAHLGPVACVIGHGVPLVNVFCQYGMLSFLVFNVLFLAIPPSYTGAAFLISFLNALQFAVLLLILLRVMRNRLLAYGTISLIGVAWLAFGSNAIPAAGAMRFFPPIALLLAVVYLPPSRIFSVFTVAAAAVCTLWSFEAMAWGLMMYFSFIVAEYVILRGRLRGLALSLAKCAAAFALPHLAYSLIVLFVVGALPSYNVYFDMIFGYTIGQRIGWTTPIDYTVLIWAIAPLCYLPVFAISSRLIYNRRDQERFDPALFARFLLPTAILGGVELSYWVGRGYLAHIWGLTLPFLAIMAVAVDRMLPGSWRTRYAIPAVATIVSVAFLYSASLAWSFKNSQLGILFNRDYLRSRWHIASSDPEREIQDQRIAEALRLVRKWSPRSRELLILMPGSITGAVLLYTGNGHLLHISNSQCDPSSLLLSNRIITQATDAVHEGELLFVQEDVRKLMYAQYSAENPAPDPDHSYSTLELTVMFKLKERWKMCLLDKTPLGIVVLRLVPKNDTNPSNGPEFALEAP